MKPFLTSMLIFVFLQCISTIQPCIFAQPSAKLDTVQTLFIIQDNGKYGLMDEKGKVWLEAKFDKIVYWTYQQSASTALYRKRNYHSNYSRSHFNNQLHHLDNNILFLSGGNRFDHKTNYEKGKLLAKVGETCFYLNEKGKPLFGEFYEDASIFDHGIAAVQQNEQVGIIDSTGQFIIKPKFRDAQILFGGEVIEVKDSLTNPSRVDRKGAIISYDEDRTKKKHNFLNSHIFLFQGENQKLGLQDTLTQKIITPAIYDKAKSSLKGTAFVLKDKKWTLIDTAGQKVIETAFDRASYFTRGWAIVWRNGQANFINPQGAFLSRNWFDDVEVNGFSYPYAQIEAYDCQLFYETDSLQNISNNASQESLKVFENCQWKKALIDTTGKIRLTFDELKCCPDETYPFGTIRRGNRWGIYNKDLEIIIEPQYQQIVLTGNNDLHFVQMPNGKNGEKGLWGLIDSQNNVLTKPQFDKIFLTFNGKTLNIEKDGKFGIMDFKGKIIIPPIYDKISGLCELHCSPNSTKDYFQAQQNGKTALFDREGNIVIDFDHEYEDIDFKLAKDLIKVKVNGKFGVVDFQGNWKIPPEYDWLHSINSRKNDFVNVGRKLVGNKSLVGLWKRNKKSDKYEELLPNQYDRISSVGENIVLLEKEEAWYYYHLIHEQFLNQEPYDKLQYHNHKFTEGSLKVQRGNKWGIVDTTGKEFVPIRHKSASQFHKGLAKVTLEGTTLLIDTLGQASDMVFELSFFAKNSPLKRFRKNDKEGLFDVNTGKIVVSAQFDKIESETLARNVCDFICSNKVARTYQGSKIGLVDLKGNILLPPIYQTIELHENRDMQKEFLSLKKDEKYGLAEKNGQIILEPKYEKLQHLAITQYLYYKNGKYGFLRIYDKRLDKEGKNFEHTEWTPPIFEYVKFFETFDFSHIIPVKKEGKWGFLEKMWNGTFDTLMIDNQFDNIEHCWEKKKKRGKSPLFWTVKKENKWGIYNGYGILIKEVVCDTIPIMYDDYFRVVENGKENFINTDGKTLSHKPQMPVEEKVPPKLFHKDNSHDFKEFKRISDKYAVFTEGEKWGILTNDNEQQQYEVHLKPQFESVEIRSQTRWISITKAGIRGFFDTEVGKVILQYGYRSPFPLNKKYISLYKNERMVIYDLEEEKLVKKTPYNKIAAIDSNLMLVSENGQQGLFDLETMKEIVEPQYESIIKDKNSTRLIIAQKKDNQFYYGLMKRTGEVIFEPIAENKFSLKEDGHYYLYFNQTYAKMDTNGKIIYTKPFLQKKTYPHPLSIVQVASTKKWGLVNESDSLVVPAVFDEVHFAHYPQHCKGCSFHVKQDGRSGTMDSLGNITFPPFPYETIKELAPNCFQVEYKGKFGLMDSLNNVILPVEYEYISKHGKDFLIFTKHKKKGLMNYKGEIILQPQFHNIGYLGTEIKRIVVYNSEQKKGLIDFEGKWILPIVYDYIDPVNLEGNTYFQVKQDIWEGLTNNKGKFIIPMKYTNIKVLSHDSYTYLKNWIKCSVGGKIAYFNAKGKRVFPAKYRDIRIVSNALAAIQLSKNNKWGLQNLQTKKWILKPIFDEYKSEGDAIKSFKITPKMAYINRKGKYVWKESGFELLE